jgi:hypothetical protein
MGFLNHATNNIIIDAVLTERGRELLANESFNITNFAFSDDEVDYSLITKFSVERGKEKIEKNTPIFEANPNENIAIKNFLITYPNPTNNLLYMPILIWDNAAGLSELSLINSTNENENSVSFIVKNFVEALGAGQSLSSVVTDTQFYVKIHNKILSITGGSSIDEDTNNVETFEIETGTASPPKWSNQKSANITVTVNGVVTDDTFTKYASILNPNVINTTIQIIGKQSGASVLVPVSVSRPA